MPHFSASWDRAIARLCPEWLEELVNEDETGDSGLDVEMSLRLFEDLPLQPLPLMLASLDDEGFKDLSSQEISAIEATFDVSSTLGAARSVLERSLSRDSSPASVLLRATSDLRPRKCFDNDDERDE